MPVVLRHDPEETAKLAQGQRAAQYFTSHLDDLQATGHRYIVLHGDELVAHAKTPELAWLNLDADAHPRDECSLFFVPQPGETYIL